MEFSYLRLRSMSLLDVKNAEEVRKHAFTIALSLSWPLFGAIYLLSGQAESLSYTLERDSGRGRGAMTRAAMIGGDAHPRFAGHFVLGRLADSSRHLQAQARCRTSSQLVGTRT